MPLPSVLSLFVLVERRLSRSQPVVHKCVRNDSDIEMRSAAKDVAVRADFPEHLWPRKLAAGLGYSSRFGNLRRGCKPQSGLGERNSVVSLSLRVWALASMTLVEHVGLYLRRYSPPVVALWMLLYCMRTCIICLHTYMHFHVPTCIHYKHLSIHIYIYIHVCMTKVVFQQGFVSLRGSTGFQVIRYRNFYSRSNAAQMRATKAQEERLGRAGAPRAGSY